MYRYNDAVTEKVVAQGMLRRTDPLRVRVRGGFSLLDMKRYAETRGYRATGDRSHREEHGNPHFVVIRGARGGEIDIADPAFGNRRMRVERFREVWRDGIGFTISRPAS